MVRKWPNRQKMAQLNPSKLLEELRWYNIEYYAAKIGNVQPNVVIYGRVSRPTQQPKLSRKVATLGNNYPSTFIPS